MAKLSSQPLKPNPFITRRDPQTGTWLVIEPDSAEKWVKNDENNLENPETDEETAPNCSP
jgi:hypothetical protein